MSQTVRTLAFLALAGISAVVAYSTHQSYQPTDLDAFSDVGEEFYADFTDANSATAMQVAAYNEENGKTDIFKVEFKDGLWRIPSHHNYPADGGDRLAKTAATIVGVERKALVERVKAAHKRYGLLDPLGEETVGTEGFGDRITLYDGDATLVDFIVGNKVEGEEETYYVRRADEDRFYTADLGSLDISTKFGDWITADILDVNKNKIRELIIDRYQIDEAKGGLVKGDRMSLNRESATADWNLKDLDPKTEKLKTADITAMMTALDDLAIVGVRPKPDGISADLKTDKGISIDTFEMMQLQERGFFIDPRQGRIFSNEGEVLVGTDDGVLYVLRFGEEFSGTDVELEVGSKENSIKTDDKAEKSDEEDTPEENETEKTEETDGLKKSRFLFVTVQFDETLLGEAPVEPVKPEPPTPMKTEEAKDSEKAEEEKPAEDDTKTEDVEETVEKSEDAEPKAEQSEDSATKQQKDYEDALVKYEDELAVYKIKKRDYDEKMKTGQERVLELNRRFADWFYVISSDVFDRMKLNRVDLVEKAEATPVDNTDLLDPNALPPGITPPKKPAKPEMKATPKAQSTEDAKEAPAKKAEPKPKDAKKPEGEKKSEKPPKANDDEQPAPKVKDKAAEDKLPEIKPAAPKENTDAPAEASADSE